MKPTALVFVIIFACICHQDEGKSFANVIRFTQDVSQKNPKDSLAEEEERYTCGYEVNSTFIFFAQTSPCKFRECKYINCIRHKQLVVSLM